MLKKIEKMSDLGLLLTLISSNYSCFEHIFRVPGLLEPLKFRGGFNTFKALNNASPFVECNSPGMFNRVHTVSVLQIR